VLARYDQLLAGFEKVYIGKWSETDPEFTESDHEWLRGNAMSMLQAEAREAQTTCQSLLYEPSLFFQAWWQKAGPEARERNRASLMECAFSVRNPILKLDDLGSETGRNIQVGYMQIFSGAMTCIRNPKAHANIEIDAVRSVHFAFLASLLFFKLDERIQ